MVIGFLALLVAFLEQALLSEAALLPERVELHRVELGALGRQLLLDMPGQRQIDVVAAEQNVLAYRGALQLQVHPPCSVTAIRVKSVVPPPMSTTRIRSPTCTRARQSGCRSIQA